MKFTFYLMLWVFVSANGYTQDLNVEPIYIIARSTFGLSGSSQTVSTSDSSYYVSQSIGQSSVIGTGISQNYNILQGFQQSSIYVQKTLSVEEINLLIGPNPVKKTLNIFFSELMSDEITVQIFETNGRLVNYMKFPAKQRLQLSMDRLAGGIYFLHITSGSKLYITKLIKE